MSGCFGLDSDDASPNVVETGIGDVAEVSVSGSVGDGPIIGGNVVIRNAAGEVIAVQQSDSFAHYRHDVVVPVDAFPLSISVEDGTDLVTGSLPDFPLMAALTQPHLSQTANLNPMGTMAVMVAGKMEGGLTDENINTASGIVETVFNFGIDTAVFDDPISAEVTSDNIANVVKASEAFGEAIRRSHLTLTAAGYDVDPASLMDTLSADLIDGRVDGSGASGSDARIAAVSNITSAQVVLETIANQLKVGGIDATQAMDQSIQQVAGSTNVALTGSVPVSQALIEQAQVLLDAAISIDSSTELESLRLALNEVEPGQLPEDLPPALLSDASQSLTATVGQVSVASEEEIAAVNEAVDSGFDAIDPVINRPPTITGAPPVQVTVSELYVFEPSSEDADGDRLAFSIVGKPGWAEFDSATGRLSGMPEEADVGTHSGVQITVSDGMASSSLFAFSIEVMPLPNSAPLISGSAANAVMVGQSYSFEPSASDTDGDELTFSIEGKPAWASFNRVTGVLSGVPDAGDEGVYSNIVIGVSDGTDSNNLEAFSITVAPIPNIPPFIDGSPAASVIAGMPYDFIPTAGDADGDTLTFFIVGKPSWAAFDQSTGRLSGVPSEGDVGVYSGIRISVSDGVANSSLFGFALEVIEPLNSAPTITGNPAQSVSVDNEYSFTPSASDADGDTLTFSIQGKPAWASFSSSTGHLSGTPDANDEGTFSNIRISVTDGEDSASLSAFTITVAPLPNNAPEISGNPITDVTVGGSYNFVPSA
ncbi:MAG: putative Ig domain-containing protein, partial [Gammaproteobacteria bacterium]|nr:putative Ig domain-containing protein [Gammaproteobacteria bacterium]